MIRTVFAGLVLCASTVQAQQELTGTWEITYAAGARIENGSRTVITAKGQLTIETQGDSLIATLVPDSLPGTPRRPPVRMTGPKSAAPYTFVAHTRANLNINGEQRETNATATWLLTVKGDSLTGTVEREIEGLMIESPGPEPVSGTRRKG